VLHSRHKTFILYSYEEFPPVLVFSWSTTSQTGEFATVKKLEINQQTQAPSLYSAWKNNNTLLFNPSKPKLVFIIFYNSAHLKENTRPPLQRSAA
jgi:hypothetical protein